MSIIERAPSTLLKIKIVDHIFTQRTLENFNFRNDGIPANNKSSVKWRTNKYFLDWHHNKSFLNSIFVDGIVA